MRDIQAAWSLKHETEEVVEETAVEVAPIVDRAPVPPVPVSMPAHWTRPIHWSVLINRTMIGPPSTFWYRLVDQSHEVRGALVFILVSSQQLDPVRSTVDGDQSRPGLAHYLLVQAVQKVARNCA